jgi:hypothetical protein
MCCGGPGRVARGGICRRVTGNRKTVYHRHRRWSADRTWARRRDRAYNVYVYVFRLAIADGKITRVDGYANPVTFAKLAGLPIG